LESGRERGEKNEREGGHDFFSFLWLTVTRAGGEIQKCMDSEGMGSRELFEGRERARARAKAKEQIVIFRKCRVQALGRVVGT